MKMISSGLRSIRFFAGKETKSPENAAEPENFNEMSSIFRIVSLYEVLLREQWKHVKLYYKPSRTKLEKGMIFGFCFEIIRFICVMLMIVLLVIIDFAFIQDFRHGTLHGHFTSISSTIFFYIWTLVLLAISIAAQFVIYEFRSPTKIAIFSSVNFLLSIVIITIFVPLAATHFNRDTLLKDLFFKNIIRLENGMKQYEYDNKCCGLNGAEDYFQSYFMKYIDPKTEEVYNIVNDMSWSISGKSFFSISPTCCIDFSSDNQMCSSQNLSHEETREVNQIIANNDYGALRRFQRLPQSGTFYQKGCLTIREEQVELYSTIVFFVMLVFTFFTAFSAGFVIVLLLYYGGIGHIVSSNKIFDVTRNTAVNIMQSLDDGGFNFEDDFSFIEFLRNTDIDDFLKASTDKIPIKN